MTLDDLKSWWKTYSPIMKEAKKRNSLTLLYNYTNVYKSMIKQCREEIKTDDDEKALNSIERALEESLLDVTLEKVNEQARIEKTSKEARVEAKVGAEPKGFVERIRERYGDRGTGGLEVRQEEEKESAGVKFENTIEREGEVRRHSIEKNFHFEDNVDNSEQNLPVEKKDLDNLKHLIYNIEKFIEDDWQIKEG